MRYLLDGMEPAAPLRFFEEITAIPRGSGGEGKVADYLVQFAEQRGLAHYRDSLNNVIIYKSGRGEPVILQGHTDMVWAWNPSIAPNADRYSDCDSYFNGECIHLVVDDGWLRASGTTLGADNAVAVCYMLALLDGVDGLPPLECVFTTQEEIGLIGASGLDMSRLTARRMLNLDSADHGVLTVSCAGGCRIRTQRGFDLVEPPVDSVGGILRVDRLLGGHSGVDADRGRQNAIWLAAHLANTLFVPLGAEVCAVDGGEADNAIPRFAAMQLVFPDKQSFCDAVNVLRDNPPTFDLEPNLTVTLESCDATDYLDHGRDIVRFICDMPHGVQSRRDGGGFVVSSLNTGVIATVVDGDTAIVRLTTGLRSSDEDKMTTMRASVSDTARSYGFSTTIGSEYPGWAYIEHSPIRDTVLEVYNTLFGEDMKVEEIHAGLECGLFTSALPGLDVVALGCEIVGLHSPDEAMRLSSFHDYWKLLVKTLERLAE